MTDQENQRDREKATRLINDAENSSEPYDMVDHIAAALSAEREKARRRCVEIISLHDCMHCGYVGSQTSCLQNLILTSSGEGEEK